MHKQILLFFSALACFYLACFGKQKNIANKNLLTNTDQIDTNFKKSNFDSSVISIDKVLGKSWTYSEQILLVPEFNNLFEHSSIYLEDAIDFLTKKKFSRQQASICLLAMQNLSLSDYLRFCRVFLNLYDGKKISELMLSSSITPNFLEKRIIAENYKDLEVINFLKDIIIRKDISLDFKKRISDILSGKYINEIKAFEQ